MQLLGAGPVPVLGLTGRGLVSRGASSHMRPCRSSQRGAGDQAHGSLSRQLALLPHRHRQGPRALSPQVLTSLLRSRAWAAVACVQGCRLRVVLPPVTQQQAPARGPALWASSGSLERPPRAWALPARQVALGRSLGAGGRGLLTLTRMSGFQARPHPDRALHPHLCARLRDSAGGDTSGHGLQHQEVSGRPVAVGPGRAQARRAPAPRLPLGPRSGPSGMGPAAPVGWGGPEYVPVDPGIQPEERFWSAVHPRQPQPP